MGFLEDVGRSNALSSVNNVMGKAIELRQGEDRSAERAYTLGLQTEELGIHKAAAEREATKFQWQAKEMAEKEAALDMPVPVTRYLGVGWENDPAKKMMFDKAKELGIIKESAGVPYTTQRHLPTFTNYMKTDLEWTKNLNATNLQKLHGQLNEIGTQLAEEKNPKKAEELTQQKDTLEKQISQVIKNGLMVDEEFQKKKALEETKAEGRIEGIQIGADAKLEAAKVAADARVEAANARAEAAKERAANAGGETKEEKRKVKAFTEARKEVEKAYGFSQFLPSAQDPKLLQKVARGKEIAEDIIDNYKNYGLSKEPKPGTAAALAKKKVDEEFTAKPAAAPAEDKKSKSIRELLFGGPKK